jgi:protein ImuB
MFACIYGAELPDSRRALLLECARRFSPHVEDSALDAVILDAGGLSSLFGSPQDIAHEIARSASELGLTVNIAIASNPDAAFHAARGFPGISVIPPGQEAEFLGGLPLEILSPILAGIDDSRALEIEQTLRIWGIRCFRDLSALPEAGLSQRLGMEGVRLQRLAKGASDRLLVPARPVINFETGVDLEHPVSLLEPLSFILASLLTRLCAHLKTRSLATNELRLRLKLENRSEHERRMRLPFAMRDARTLLKLLELDVERNPPQAPVLAVWLAAEPVKPRVIQNGLFVPLSPAPEKLELTLARIAKLVGSDNVGAVELVDTHRPGAFRIRHFTGPENDPGHANPAVSQRLCLAGFRVFRPPLCAEVDAPLGFPIRVGSAKTGSLQAVQGDVVASSGPWRTSGEWWSAERWSKDEWDVELDNGMLCRIARDLDSGSWFIEGTYD